MLHISAEVVAPKFVRVLAGLLQHTGAWLETLLDDCCATFDFADFMQVFAAPVHHQPQPGNRKSKIADFMQVRPASFFFTLVTGPRRSLSLKLSDTRVNRAPSTATRKPDTGNREA